jgi:hypothetical protein
MNPWGIIIIAVGIIMVYIGIKGNPHSVVSGLKSAYGQVPASTTSASTAKPTTGTGVQVA